MESLPLSQPELILAETPEDTSGWWTWTSWQVILILVNALLGLITFEWAWYQTYRFRKPIAELENLLPAFRRNDAKFWHKLTFYPGALTLLWPRFWFGVVDVTILCFFMKIFLIGQPMAEPLTGCRRVLIRWIFKFFTFNF
jgi:hypothetical protein